MVCMFCNKVFSSKHSLAAHMGVKHKEEFKTLKNNEIVFPGITRYELEEMRKNASVCAICGKTETANTRPDVKDTPNQLCADHNHITGNFRGFLCVQCNRNMGWFDKYQKQIEKYNK